MRVDPHLVEHRELGTPRRRTPPRGCRASAAHPVAPCVLRTHALPMNISTDHSPISGVGSTNTPTRHPPVRLAQECPQSPPGGASRSAIPPGRVRHPAPYHRGRRTAVQSADRRRTDSRTSRRHGHPPWRSPATGHSSAARLTVDVAGAMDAVTAVRERNSRAAEMSTAASVMPGPLRAGPGERRAVLAERRSRARVSLLPDALPFQHDLDPREPILYPWHGQRFVDDPRTGPAEARRDASPRRDRLCRRTLWPTIRSTPAGAPLISSPPRQDGRWYI